VYNTLALLIAIFRCQTLKEHRGLLFSRRTLQKAAASQNFAGTLPFAAFAGEVRWRRIGLVLVTMAGALIILSTVFIKQHSILDAFGAAALLALIAFGVYWVFPRVFLRV
jgi:membrane-associated phospholipid phosphatase